MAAAKIGLRVVGSSPRAYSHGLGEVRDGLAAVSGRPAVRAGSDAGCSGSRGERSF
jgi:alpha/beta superfamily hydrolase